MNSEIEHEIRDLREWCVRIESRLDKRIDITQDAQATLGTFIRDIGARLDRLERAPSNALDLRPGDELTVGPGIVRTFGETFEKIYQEVRRIATGELTGGRAQDAAMRVMKLLPHPYKRP